MRFAAGVLLLCAAAAGAAAAVGEPAPPPDPRGPGGVPSRIVSTSLPTDEILLALLPPERLLAVSTFADDPLVSNVREEARGVPHRVTGRAEEIIALGPGVVLTFPFARPEGQALLRRAGIPIVHVESPESLDGIRDNVRRLGRLTDRAEAAEALVGRMDARLASVRARVDGARRPRVLVYFSSGHTAGSQTVLGDLVRAAGGDNAADDAGLGSVAPLSRARLLSLDPDVVLFIGYRADSRERGLLAPTGPEDDPALRALRAAKNGRLHRMSGRHLLSHSHHAVTGAERLARLLHPGRFRP
jgi:iron complex transport system substrate-binding protein